MMLTHPEIWEFIAAGFGVISVVLSARANIWVFPTGMVSVFIYVLICYDYGIYADMGVNAYYFLMSIYGWYHWSAGTISQNKRSIERVKRSEVLKLVLLFVVSFVGLYFILQRYSDSSVPIFDSLTTALAICAMWLMALKRLEHWVLWILTDLLSIALYYYKGLNLTSMQYLVFTFIAIYGFIDWKQKIKNESGITSP